MDLETPGFLADDYAQESPSTLVTFNIIFSHFACDTCIGDAHQLGAKMAVISTSFTLQREAVFEMVIWGDFVSYDGDWTLTHQ